MSTQAIINSLFQANYYTGVTTSAICLKCDGTTEQSGTTACQGIMDANVSVTQLPESKKGPKPNKQKTINQEMLLFNVAACPAGGPTLLFTIKKARHNHGVYGKTGLPRKI